MPNRMAIAKKKKKFFEVEIPIINKTTQLYALEQKELEDKFVIYDLTRMLKGKSVLLTNQVKIKDEKLTTIPLGIKVMKHSIKNFVRKGTDYVEDSFNAKTKDAEVIVKPILVARRRISRKVRSALRKAVKEELIQEFSKLTADQAIDDLLKNKIQKPLSLKLKKIYPLSLCEIRYFKVKEFKPQEEIKETKKKTIKKEVEEKTEDKETKK